jgi:hypothetical protein
LVTTVPDRPWQGSHALASFRLPELPPELAGRAPVQLDDGAVRVTLVEGGPYLVYWEVLQPIAGTPPQPNRPGVRTSPPDPYGTLSFTG